MAEHLNTNVLNSFGKIDIEKIDKYLSAEIQKNTKKWIVLDDDPTGVQTVHDISVYTSWDKESLKQAFEEEGSMFFILTNSRGYSKDETIKLHKEIAENVVGVAKELGKSFQFISRSDSTLRGHYPTEPEVLKEMVEKSSGEKVDGEIMCPFFPEGGRFTIGNIHYVQYGEELVPAAETEFAKDKSFGYSSSDMCEYIEEKTKGAYKKEDVITIPLEMIHSMDIDGIKALLMKAENFSKIIVNAVNYDGLKVVCTAIYRAMAEGKTFMFRTAAGIVKVLGGVSDKPLLTKDELITKDNGHGGIIVIGSYTQKTTKQLENLKLIDEITFFEMNSDLALEENGLETEVERLLKEEEKLISEGKTVAVYTKRTQLALETDSNDDILKRSVRISKAVSDLVGKLKVEPGFVIAKGGITSFDVGVNALQVKRANVLGQIKPGIPVWQTGENSKFPGIPYVIFPGNVGTETTLKEATEVLMK